MRRALRLVVGWLVIAWFTACQTGGYQGPVVAPPAALKLFGNCAPGDGAVSMQLADGGALVGSLDVNWIARSREEWQLELSDPLGRSLLQVHSRGPKLEVTGPLAVKLPPLAVDDDGYLTIKGHTSGLKIREVPCLLGFVYPKPWLPELVGRDERAGAKPELRLSFSEPGRDLDLTLSGAGLKSLACADISWREYLILSRKLTWCLPGGTRRSASLTGLQAYKLTWVQIDE